MFGRRRNERHWETVEQLAPFRVGPVAHQRTVVVICRHRQRARSGLKAYIEFPPFRGLHAAWFPRRWPPVGTQLLLSGHFWYETWETHHDEVVFWVDEVYASADARAVKGWRKHQRRLQRRKRDRGATSLEPANGGS